MRTTIMIILTMLTVSASSQLTQPDSLRPPTRLVWQGEKGVFLTQRQEELTLEKLQWKDVYKNDAITFYMVSLQLNNQVEALKRELETARTETVRAEDEAKAHAATSADYARKWKDEQDANAIIRDEKRALQAQLFKSRLGNVVLGVGLLTLGVAALAN